MKAGTVTAVTSAITSVSNLFDRAISAYENCKRIDFQMAELKAKRELAMKAVELKKREMEKSEKEFNRICKHLDEQLSSFRMGRKWYLTEQKHWLRQSDIILKEILNSRGDDPKIETLRSLWEKCQARLENAAREENIAVLNLPNSAQKLFETHNARVGCSMQQQIGLHGSV